ncbi:MAG TPA: hypothetical protein VH120_00535, partial [Gemmataceae bacterium]|nr:hypothetical protein [Gemmataceae bacterium]
DEEHLRLLAVFHYVVAGLAALVACLPILHLAFGIAIVLDAFPAPPNGVPPPALLGWVLIGLASIFIVVGWTFAIALAVAGRLLQRRRGYTYCLVLAAIACVFTPFGTVLGVFTLIVLLRPSVKGLFRRGGEVWAEPGS